jgi:uncharacterized protein YjbJ (UPF0337 family)
MDESRFEGLARDVGGKIQDAVGSLTGDAKTQERGKANQAAGQAQNTYGQAIDRVRDFATEAPVSAMLSALGVGLVLGWMATLLKTHQEKPRPQCTYSNSPDPCYCLYPETTRPWEKAP